MEKPGIVRHLLLALLAVVGSLLPFALGGPSAAIAEDVCAAALDRYVMAPESRQVFPQAIERAEAHGGTVVNPDGLLAPGGSAAVIQRTPGSDPHIVLDFGRNLSGQLRLSTSSSSSPELRVAVAEALTFLGPESDVVWGDQRTQVWQPGQGADAFTSSQLTFRYAMLFLATDGWVEIDSVELQFTPFLGTASTFQGCFESSDDLLNRIWYAGAYTVDLTTVRAGERELLLDGAKRDRMVWVGDLALEGSVELLTHYRAAPYRDSLAEMADRQRSNGTIPPSSYDNYSLILYDYYAWWVVAFADYYTHTGDRAFAEAYFGHMRRQLEWLATQVNADGLLVKNAGIEWAFTLGREGTVTYLNAVYYRALLDASRLAAHFGHPEDAANWRERAAAVRTGVNATLWDEQRGVYVDSDRDRLHVPQDGNALAVLFDIAPPDRAARVLGYLEQHHWTPFGSTTVDPPYGTDLYHDRRIWPFMGYYEVEARFHQGWDDSALELIRREWGHMLQADPASTMWEWMTADGRPENGFASLAHGWSAGATAALTESLLGIRPTAPLYDRFDAVPHPGDVTWARGRVPTPHGSIEASWQLERDVFTEQLVVPDGTRARAGVPTEGRPAAVWVDGQLAWNGTTALGFGARDGGGYVFLDLGPGTHQIYALTDMRYFSETGQFLNGTFNAFWERSGGLPVFGYPLTDETTEDGRTVQYFERQRFELHPENAGTPYEVLLGRLGVDDAERRGLLDDPAFATRSADAAPGCRYFAETSHQLCGRFRAYWESHGLEFSDTGVTYRESLALFGFPISEEFVDPETGLVTQYFERARFEYHPTNAGTPYEVLLGRLGAELVDSVRLTIRGLVQTF